jgi:hypothetical protein
LHPKRKYNPTLAYTRSHSVAINKRNEYQAPGEGFRRGLEFPRIHLWGSPSVRAWASGSCSRLSGYATSDERCAGVGMINVLNDLFFSSIFISFHARVSDLKTYEPSRITFDYMKLRGRQLLRYLSDCHWFLPYVAGILRTRLTVDSMIDNLKKHGILMHCFI